MEFGALGEFTFDASEIRALSGAGATTVVVAGSVCVVSCIGKPLDMSVLAATIGVFMSAVEIAGCASISLGCTERSGWRLGAIPDPAFEEATEICAISARA